MLNKKKERREKRALFKTATGPQPCDGAAVHVAEESTQPDNDVEKECSAQNGAHAVQAQVEISHEMMLQKLGKTLKRAQHACRVMQVELAETKKELTATQGELGATQEELVLTKEELTTAREELAKQPATVPGLTPKAPAAPKPGGEKKKSDSWLGSCICVAKDHDD